MSESTARVQVKIGGLEIDCQGSEIFLKEGMPNLVNQLIDTCLKHKDAIQKIAPVPPPPPLQNSQSPLSNQSELDLSTETIAARLGAASGSDLAIAAAAHLVLVDQQSKFTRKELLDEMQTATSYYKKTFSDNFSSYLKTLVTKGRINGLSKGSYALTAKELEDLKVKLA